MKPGALRLIFTLIVAAVCSAHPLVARHVPITIVHTTDLHGRVLPTRDYDGTDQLGGLLRCATLIEKLRAAHPNLLLVDCGDLYQGSMESFLSNGLIMNRALDWLGYDAWVLGNHEFDWGLDVLAAAVDDSAVPILAANMTVRPGGSNPLPQVRPYIIRNVDGVRVALVGLSSEAIPYWSRPHLLGDLLFGDSVEALQRVMPDVRAERPDVMVLLLHQGYRPFGDSHANRVNRIARHFPEFDLIVGGHSHQPIERARVNGVLYTQAGYYGIWLGKATLLYDTVAREVVERSARLYHVADAYEPQADLKAFLQEDIDRARAAAAEQIGSTTDALQATSGVPGQSAIQELICRAIAEAANVEIVLHGTLSDEEWRAGPIYEADLWRIVPYDNTLGVVQITAADVREILEENADLIGRSQFLGVYGIHYDLHADAPSGDRIQNLRFADGSAIHPRRRLAVAMNSYVLASGGRRFPLVRRLADDPVTRLEMMPVDTRTAVRNYLRRHSPLEIKANEAAMRRIGREE